LDITWHGHSCFRITERGQTTIVTDPYYPEAVGLPELKVKGDIVTISHPEDPTLNNAEAVKGYNYTLQGAGEYEFEGTFVWGLPLHNPKADGGQYNFGYQVQYESGLNVLHLGRLTYLPEQSLIKDLGDVHVLLLPIGGVYSLRPSIAAEVVALIEPSYVVPMQYNLPGMALDLGELEAFTKAMGISKIEKDDYLRVNSTTMNEQPQVIILEPNLGE
jgi:L-ascorbate metabolism protein UlaG (beta-lactamase superfamily)